MKGLKALGIALSLTAVSAALASGWTVNVSTSRGLLFQPSQPADQSSVPFLINNSLFNATPTSHFVNTLPQITFLTSVPPMLVGDGTRYTGGTFTAAYTITSSKAPLTGFNFVVRGFVFDLGQIIWSKKVVDLNTSEILYLGQGFFSGAGYAGGSDGFASINQFVPLARPSSNVQVIETFILHIDGAPAPGTSTASLLLVEQDWVPEPASLLALSAGLAGLLGLRRRLK